MNLPSRLDRLAALRPAAPRLPAAAPERRVEIAAVLGCLGRRTERGEHAVLEERLSGPVAFQPTPEALALLGAEPTSAVEDSGKWLFLDTETTGLSGGTGTYPFLVGLAWWDADGFTVRQLLMRDPREEPSLLTELREYLEGRSVIVTFNGKTFDWPLLETRFRMARMGAIPTPALHLDLLHPARQIWRHRLESVALAELERAVLGIPRADDIPSAEIPRVYFDFLRGHGGEGLGAVLRHNRMDLAGLGTLTARVLALLADPDSTTTDPVELYGISRIIQRRGGQERAARLYERSLQRGLPAGAAVTARRELALFAKRSGDYERANIFWGELSESPGDDVRACEELAIHYEHRVNDFAEAARLTREAIARAREAFTSRRIPLQRFQRLHAALQHRLDRIRKRQSVDS